MFNKKLRMAICDLESQVADLKVENMELSIKQFRVGDKVYINDGRRSLLTPVYLRKAYNGGTCYYITTTPDAIINESIYCRVNIKNISNKHPKTCECCGSLLTKKEISCIQ